MVLLVPVLNALILCSAPVPGAAPQKKDELTGWLEELNRLRDDVKPELIRKIAEHRSRRAMEGLLAVYDELKTIYMQREVVRALSRFDGVEHAEQPALTHLANVAAGSPAPELRRAAVDALGECPHLGNHFLARIVDSEAQDDLRLHALQTHVERAKKTDADWYRYVWNPKREKRKKGKGVEVPELEAIRETAFAGLSAFLDDRQLADTMKSEFNPRIRRAALQALLDRKSKRASTMAMWLFKRTDIPGSERAVAARALAEVQGPRVASLFLAMAKKEFVTQEDLRQTIADLLVAMQDKHVDKRLARLVGRGKPHEKVFALLATRHLDDPKLLGRIRRGLGDKSFDVRRATARALAARGDRESLPALREMLTRAESTGDVRIAIEAICGIEKQAPGWIRELEGLCRSPVRETRNTALQQLGAAGDPAFVPELTAALGHEDWTTRLVAVQALAGLRRAESIPALIARLPQEKGRMAKEIADVLWSLTGKPFDENAKRWKDWWDKEGADFKAISLEDLAKAEQERELRRLKQRTVSKPEFFGIRIESHRVIFIIDTSGSMVDPVNGEYEGRRQATRLDVAKRELKRSVENLSKDSLFNIISFSFGVGRWLKSGIATSSQHSRAAALEFVDRLGAGGPTNLYDTLEIAFEDPDVDTIYLLSDGEPTTGKVMDPHRIREDVRFWNQHRHVRIHTIAIGGNLEILEWLAADSGGEHIKIR